MLNKAPIYILGKAPKYQAMPLTILTNAKQTLLLPLTTTIIAIPMIITITNISIINLTTVHHYHDYTY